MYALRPATIDHDVSNTWYAFLCSYIFIENYCYSLITIPSFHVSAGGICFVTRTYCTTQRKLTWNALETLEIRARSDARDSYLIVDRRSSAAHALLCVARTRLNRLRARYCCDRSLVVDTHIAVNKRSLRFADRARPNAFCIGPLYEVSKGQTSEPYRFRYGFPRGRCQRFDLLVRKRSR